MNKFFLLIATLLNGVAAMLASDTVKVANDVIEGRGAQPSGVRVPKAFRSRSRRPVNYVGKEPQPVEN